MLPQYVRKAVTTTSRDIAVRCMDAVGHLVVWIYCCCEVDNANCAGSFLMSHQGGRQYDSGGPGPFLHLSDWVDIPLYTVEVIAIDKTAR